MDINGLKGKPIQFSICERQTLLDMIAEGSYDPATIYITQTDEFDGTRLFPYLGKQELSANSIQYKRYTSKRMPIHVDTTLKSTGKAFISGELRFLKCAPIVMLKIDLDMEITRRYVTQIAGTGIFRRLQFNFADGVSESTVWQDIGQPEISWKCFLPDTSRYAYKMVGDEVGHFICPAKNGDSHLAPYYEQSVYFPCGFHLDGGTNEFNLFAAPIIDAKFMVSKGNEFPGADSSKGDTEQSIHYCLHHTITYMGDFKVADPVE